MIKMIDISKLTDSYERKARVYPALVSLIPLVVAIYVALPDIFDLWSGLVAILVGLGLLQLLSNLCRDRGKRLQEPLFKEWGGTPSVAILRCRDRNIPEPAKRRYHELLAQRTGITAPTDEFENENPDKADEVYQSWSDYLRAATRNKNEFPMVFKENTNYGFRRNLLGIKAICLLSGSVALLITALRSLVVYKMSGEISAVLVSAAIAAIIYNIIIAVVVNKARVKTTAFEYAKQLIESLNV